MKLIFSVTVPHDFDLTPVKGSVAKEAEPAIIERVPPSKLIQRTQDRQSILNSQMCFHNGTTGIRKKMTSRELETIGRQTG
jgi:hypothetical protein